MSARDEAINRALDACVRADAVIDYGGVVDAVWPVIAEQVRRDTLNEAIAVVEKCDHPEQAWHKLRTLLEATS